MEFLVIIACIIINALAIKKTNEVRRNANAVLEDIEAHQKFLIAVAAKESRRSRWRK